MSAEEPASYKPLFFANEILDVVAELKTKGWQSKRFKKFPKFNIYSKSNAKDFLNKKIISLNDEVLHFIVT